MKVQADDVWPVVLSFIEQYVGKKELKAFKEQFSVDIDHSEDTLVKAGGIPTLLATFFKHNKAEYKKFVKAKKAKAPASSDSDNDSDAETKKKTKK